MPTVRKVQVILDMTVPTKKGSKKKMRVCRGQSLGFWHPAAAQRLVDEAKQKGWLDGFRVANIKLIPVKVRIR